VDSWFLGFGCGFWFCFLFSKMTVCENALFLVCFCLVFGALCGCFGVGVWCFASVPPPYKRI
jgi:hypothetical protein